jgi:hypothetical protein
MKLISIEKNENLREWLNVRIFGKVVETEKSLALAMEKAKELQAQEQPNTRSPFIIIVNQNAK